MGEHGTFMHYLYVITSANLLFAGIGIFLLQAYFWFVHQDWTPAPLSLFWEIVGISGPLGELSLAGVFMLFGGWFTWEGVKRGKSAAQSE